MSNIFRGYQFTLELDYSFRYKQKQELKKKITNNGGIISYILTKKINFLIVSNINQADSTYKGRTAQKNAIPIVTIEFVNQCVKEQRIVDSTLYLATGGNTLTNFEEGKIKAKPTPKNTTTAKTSTYNVNAIRVWKWGDNKAPEFDEEHYEVAKSCLLKSCSKPNKDTMFYQLELHVIPFAKHSSENENKKHCFRVFCHYGNCKKLEDDTSGTKECRYLLSSTDALKIYAHLYKMYTGPAHNYKKSKFISRWIGSDKQKKISLESSFESGTLSSEVVELVEHIWQEANEELNTLLSFPEASVKKEQVEKAEAILLQIKHELDTDNKRQELEKLSKKFFELIPLQKGQCTIEDKRTLARVNDICQLIKDIVSVSEATDFSERSSIDAKYRALRCHIEYLPLSSPEYKKISDMVKSDMTSRNKFKIKNIFAVNRPIEETNFNRRLGNEKLLFHSSKPANFVGIFTRGLLLPKIVVDDFGGKRTDPGNLGSGIYFTDSSSTSGKYTSRSTVKGTRFMLVNEVALGKCLDMKSKDYKLSASPEGYDSVHGVKKDLGIRSDFEDDEFVVYDTHQQRIRYLVEFVFPEDSIKDIIQQSLKETKNEDEDDVQMMDISIDDIKSIANPLDKVKAGLQSKDNSSVPLIAVHIRAKLIDLAAQVVVLQAYKNSSTYPIEAKYVFPLDDMAAVCGFEAFINGKHIIGEVKEKEVAHKEYKEAISKGHGAYLMDEETPDVFTVSVGNLPPESEVLIKITYVAELAVESGNIMFNLPGSVAPWKKDSALSVSTQEQIGTVHCGRPSGETSLQIAVEMPYDIISIKSPTHLINLKQSTTKATVKLNKNVGIGKGFQLLIQLAEIHVPRMWVEKHSERLDNQACMLSFYPEFESKEAASPEILFVLDLSNSMKGENLLQAKKILLMNLHYLPPQATFNIITFGTNYDEVFPICQPANSRNTLIAKTFIRKVQANMGNTEVWRPLHSYFLLSDASRLRNIFLISDGHINNEESTLAAIRLNARNNRVFTFGVSATANKHLLRAIARVGTGAFEFFDTSTKSKWEKKVKGQLLKARQPALSNVSIEWHQSDDNAPKPIQAPGQITSLFSGSRQVVYGYVPSCRQATLKAYINGDEISTTVSTNEFSVTRGKILHQLTARAIIRDWEDGTLDADPVQHDIKKDAQKSYIIELSKEYSIVTQFTSFVAIEEREKTDFVGTIFKPSISDLVAEEDVDDLPYANWEGSGVTETEESPKVAKSGLDVPRIDPPASSFSGSDLDKVLRECHYLIATDPKKKKKNLLGAKKKTSVTNNIEEIRDIMQQNVDLVLERDAKLSDLDGLAMDFGTTPKSRKQLHKRRKKAQTSGYTGKTIPTIGFSENIVKELTARRANCMPDLDDEDSFDDIMQQTGDSVLERGEKLSAAKTLRQSMVLTKAVGSVGKTIPTIGFSEGALNKMINKRTNVNYSSDSDDEDLCVGVNFNAYDPTIEDSYSGGDFNAYEPTIEDSYGESLKCAGFMDFNQGPYLQCGLMGSDEGLPFAALKKKFGFAKFKRRKASGRKAMVLESCAQPSYARYRPYLSNTVEEMTRDIKERNEIDFDLLSFYQRETLEVTRDERSALYRALYRVSNRQIHNGSWVIKCLRELLKLEELIKEHAQKLATEDVSGKASDYEAILSTAVVVCLLEYVLMNWTYLYKIGTDEWDERYYRDVFVSLGIGERFIREVRFSKRRQMSWKGTSWIDYAEKNLLHVIPQTGLNVQTLVFVGVDGFFFPRKREFWLEERPWEDRSFWTLSPTHAVLFNVRRHYVIFLLEQAGLKSLELSLQKKTQCMLAMAIGIVRIEPAVKCRIKPTNNKLTDGLEQLNIWLNEMEKEHYGLASHLELGKDWRDVASKLINSSMDSAY